MATRVEVSWAQLIIPDPAPWIPIQPGGPLGCKDVGCGCAACCGAKVLKVEPQVTSLDSHGG